jgi:hypothetical protein
MLYGFRVLAPLIAIILVTLGGIAYATDHPKRGAFLVVGGLVVAALMAVVVVWESRKWHRIARRLHHSQRELAKLRREWPHPSHHTDKADPADVTALRAFRDDLFASVPRRFGKRFDSALGSSFDDEDGWTISDRDVHSGDLVQLLEGMIQEWADGRPS